MAKQKTGLHKEVTSIFDGVPIRKNKVVQQPPYAPAADRTDYDRPEPAASVQQTAPVPSVWQPEQIPPKPKSPPSARALPKTVSLKQSKADTIKKTWQHIKDKLFTPKPGVSSARQKAMVVLVPVLFVILIFVFTQFLGTPSRKSAKDPIFGPTSAIANSDNVIDWQIPAFYTAMPHDPMQFGSEREQGEADTGGPIVRGILYSEDDPTAVIGTQIVHTGDEVLGATVVKINQDSVDLKMGEKKWTQKVQSEFAK